MTEKKEFENILEITAKVFNVDVEKLVSKDRALDLAIPRNVAAVIGMRDALLKKETITKVLNRHRTSAYHYLKTHKIFFDYYAPYRKGYIKALKEFKKIDANKKVFINKGEFNLFIKNIKVKNSLNPDIIISVSCGDFSHSFLSDCFKFSDDIITIKEAFNGYKRKINYNTYEG